MLVQLVTCMLTSLHQSATVSQIEGLHVTVFTKAKGRCTTAHSSTLSTVRSSGGRRLWYMYDGWGSLLRRAQSCLVVRSFLQPCSAIHHATRHLQQAYLGLRPYNVVQPCIASLLLLILGLLTDTILWFMCTFPFLPSCY